MHPSRVVAALLHNCLNPIFFAKVVLANELDCETLFLGDLFSVSANLFAQGCRKLGVGRFKSNRRLPFLFCLA